MVWNGCVDICKIIELIFLLSYLSTIVAYSPIVYFQTAPVHAGLSARCTLAILRAAAMMCAENSLCVLRTIAACTLSRLQLFLPQSYLLLLFARPLSTLARALSERTDGPSVGRTDGRTKGRASVEKQQQRRRLAVASPSSSSSHSCAFHEEAPCNRSSERREERD